MSAPASAIKTMVVVGSTRAGRMGDRVGKFIADQVKASGKLDMDYVDLAQLKLGLMENAVHLSAPGTVPEHIMALAKRVSNAEAYILISPEYNHSAGPALLNFLNHFPPSSYALKPSAIAVYSMGPFGGMRAAMQLRALTGELGCVSVSTIFAAPMVQNSLNEQGKPVGDSGKLLVDLAAKSIGQLSWTAQAFKAYKLVKPTP